MAIRYIPNLSALVRAVNDVSKNQASKEIWWRGQAQSNWKLLPNVFRKGRRPAFEHNAVMRFKRAASTRYLNCPPEDDENAWLFLMQHHSLPTRLLDWTESPLIATFFAVKYATGSDAALWALNSFALNRSQTNRSTLFSPDDPTASPLFESVFKGEEAYKDTVLALFAKEVDLRMLVQRSTFTIHGSPKPLEDYETVQPFLRKFTIPAPAKTLITRELEAMGIRLLDLFPDLDHLAEYLTEAV